jgi:hypothetical protein
MSDLSFNSFAQAKGFTLPVNAVAVAKSMNMVSMRAMIATAKPFPPSDLWAGLTSSGAQEFRWSDLAVPPYWAVATGAQGYPLRAAKSFEFKVRQSSGLALPAVTIIADQTKEF